jgi:phosphatidate cytidylyltransferase
MVRSLWWRSTRCCCQLAAAAGYAAADAIAAAIWSLALLLTGLSIIGDLFESVEAPARRQGQRGHSPGHGGVLDRIDALTAAMPPAALIAQRLLG